MGLLEEKNMTKKKFDKELNNFVELAQKMIDAHFKLNYKNLKPNLLVVKPGKRYVKIISEAQAGSGRSVWAFVEKETGDILRPATWNAPAKHARGNIYSEDNGISCVTPYGPHYLTPGRKSNG